MKYNYAIHRLPDDVRTGAIHCNIGKNHTILCRHVEHKRCYEAKTKWNATWIIGSKFPVVLATNIPEYWHQ